MLTYLTLIPFNFLSQRKIIFKKKGVFWKFLILNLITMLAVSLLSGIFYNILHDFELFELGASNTCFVIAASLFSYPSFLLKKHFVFKHV